MSRFLPLLLPFLLAGIFSCARVSPVFLEEKTGEDTTAFQYYSAVVGTWDELFKLDENFRKKQVGAKDREKYVAYSRISFDDKGIPKRIENYRQDSFNAHVYYPYQIFVIEPKENEYKVSQTLKRWENQMLVVESITVRAFEKSKDENFSAIMQAYATDTTSFENRFFVFNFIPEDNDANKKVQESVTADLNYIILEGFEEAHFNVRLRIFFFDALRSEAGLCPLGQTTRIRARFTKSTPGVLDFVFVEFVKEQKDSGVNSDMYKTE